MAVSRVPEHCYVDTNVVLRYLLGEPAEQAAAARDLFRRAGEGEMVLGLHPAVLAEVVYVMCSPRALGGGRGEVVAVLRELLALPGVQTPDSGRVLDALRRFETTRLDWVDALLLAHTSDAVVYSFDGAMQKAGARRPGGPG